MKEKIFQVIRKRDLFFSGLCGFLAGVFLILIVSNPEIQEFEAVKQFVWFLPFLFSVLFSLGLFLVKILFRSKESLFQFVKFGETGVLNTFMDIGLYNGLIWITGITQGIFIIPINLFSISLATTNSFFWNKFWTFNKKEKAKTGEFLQFFAISIIGAAINTSIVFLGTTYLHSWVNISDVSWAGLVKVAATSISMIWNFIGYKYIVFKR